MKKVLLLAIAAFTLFVAEDVLACTAVLDIMPQDDSTPTINCKKNGLLPISLLFVCNPSTGDCSCDDARPNLEGITALRCKPDDAEGDALVNDLTCWWKVSDVCSRVCDGTVEVTYTSCGTFSDTNYTAINCPE